MPVGTGILGQVAAGVAPFQTSDYLGDPSMPHVPEIDGIVEAEGVRTVMGVPLVVGAEVIGALMVAERRPRVFSPVQIDIVDSFGRLVAIALKNADHHAQTQQRLDASQRRVETAESELVRRQQQRAFAEQLRARIVLDPSVQCLVEFTAEYLNTVVALFDSEDHVLAHSDPRIERVSRLAEMNGTLAPSGPESVLATGTILEEEERLILECAADHVQLALVAGRSQEDPRHRHDRELFDDLVKGTKEAFRQWRRHLAARRSGELEEAHLLLLDCVAPQAAMIERALRRRPETVLVAHVPDGLCAVLSSIQWLDDLPALVQRAIQSPTASNPRGAVAGPMPVPGSFRRLYAQARSGFVLQRHRSCSGILDANQVGLLGHVVDAARNPDHHIDLEAPLTPLLDDDEARNGRLTQTALSYFENDRRIDHTAEALFVHRNTVKLRLARISRLLGDGWDRAPRGIDMHWALRAWAWSLSIASSTDDTDDLTR